MGYVPLHVEEMPEQQPKHKEAKRQWVAEMLGRPLAQAQSLRADGLSYRQIGRALGVGKSVVHRMLEGKA